MVAERIGREERRDIRHRLFICGSALFRVIAAKDGFQRRDQVPRITSLVLTDGIGITTLNRSHKLEQYLDDLLRKHLIVSLNGWVLEIGASQFWQSRGLKEPVSPTSLAAVLNTIRGNRCRE